MNNFFTLFIQITVMSSIMTAIVLLVSRIFNSRLHTKVILFLWLIVLVRLITPVIIDSPIHLEDFIPNNQESDPIKNDITGDNYVIDTNDMAVEYTPVNETNDINAPYVDNNNAAEQSNATIGFFESVILYLKDVNIAYYVLAIWFLGGYIMTFKKIGASYRFARIIKVDTEIDLTDILNECRKRLKYNKNVTIKTSKHISTPIVYGCIKPTILLPEDLIKTISRDKLLFILMHEISHIKRRDIIKNYLWMIARIIHWFNPLVHIAYKNYIENVELACDQMVVDNISDDERFEYSQSLLDVIKLSQSKVLFSVPSGMSFCEDKSKIRKRVEKMFNSKRQIKSVGIISIILAFVMIFCCFTTACLPNENNEIEPVEEIESSEETHIEAIENNNAAIDDEAEAIVIAHAINYNPWIMDIETTVLEDGGICVTYRLNDGSAVELRESDNSLLGLEYGNNISNDIITFNEVKAIEIAKELLDEYINFTELNVTHVGLGETMCTVDGTFKKNDDRLYEFFLSFNANEELVILQAFPMGVEGIDETIDENQINEYAVKHLISQGYDFVDIDYITIIDVEKNPHGITDQYFVKLEYAPIEATVNNYPFTAEMYINLFSGELESGIRMLPDFEQVDMLSIDEAIAVARERILITYDLEDYKLVATEVWISANKTITYQIDFKSIDTEQKYYVNLYAQTGEITDRGRYAEGYGAETDAEYEEQLQKWLDTAEGHLKNNYPHIEKDYLFLRDYYRLSYLFEDNTFVVKYHYIPVNPTEDNYGFEAKVIMDGNTYHLIEIQETPIE